MCRSLVSKDLARLFAGCVRGSESAHQIDGLPPDTRSPEAIYTKGCPS